MPSSLSMSMFLMLLRLELPLCKDQCAFSSPSVFELSCCCSHASAYCFRTGTPSNLIHHSLCCSFPAATHLNVPHAIDLDRLRGSGLQPGEVAYPEGMVVMPRVYICASLSPPLFPSFPLCFLAFFHFISLSRSCLMFLYHLTVLCTHSLFV